MIKKGEHGAFMFTPHERLLRAGVSARGGLRSHRRGRLLRRRLHRLSRAQRRPQRGEPARAVVYGSAMGSFAVERFSIARLLEITHARHPGARRGVPPSRRLRAGDDDVTQAARLSRRRRRHRGGRRREAPHQGARRVARSPPARAAKFGGFGGHVPRARGRARRRCSSRAPTASARRSRSRSRPTATTRSATIS